MNIEAVRTISQTWIENGEQHVAIVLAGTRGTVYGVVQEDGWKLAVRWTVVHASHNQTVNTDMDVNPDDVRTIYFA